MAERIKIRGVWYTPCAQSWRDGKRNIVATFYVRDTVGYVWTYHNEFLTVVDPAAFKARINKVRSIDPAFWIRDPGPPDPGPTLAEVMFWEDDR